MKIEREWMKERLFKDREGEIEKRESVRRGGKGRWIKGESGDKGTIGGKKEI